MADRKMESIAVEKGRETFKLTAGELLFLTVLLGGERFPGLDAGWDTLSEAGLRAVMDAARQQLEAKGLLECGLDGVARMPRTLRLFVTAASSCSSYYGQFLYQGDAVLEKIYYFQEGEQYYDMVMVMEGDISTFVIQPLYGKEEMQVRMVERFPLVEGDGPSEELPPPGRLLEQLLTPSVEGEPWKLASLLKLEFKGEEQAVTRELSILIHRGRMWKVDDLEEEQAELSGWSSLPFPAAMEELSVWVNIA